MASCSCFIDALSFCILPSMPDNSFSSLCVCDHFPPYYSPYSVAFLLKSDFWTPPSCPSWTWWNPFRLTYRNHRDSAFFSLGMVTSSAEICASTTTWSSFPLATVWLTGARSTMLSSPCLLYESQSWKPTPANIPSTQTIAKSNLLF